MCNIPYGFWVYIGIIIGYYIFEKRLKDSHFFTKQKRFLIFLFSPIFVWLGAKAYFSLIETPILYKGISNLLKPRGHSFFGGFIIGNIWICVASYLLSKPKKINGMFEFLDASALVWLLTYATGRLGCHFTGDGCYGIPTSLPWGMSYPNGIMPTHEKVHPTPLYETSAALFLFIFFLKKRWLYPGIAYGIFMILFPMARFLIEFIRLNPKYGIFTLPQWISVLILIPSGLIILLYINISRKRLKPANLCKNPSCQKKS